MTGVWAASGEGWEYAVAFGFDLRSGGKCLQSFKQGRHIIRCALESSSCRAWGQSPGRMKPVRRLMEESSQKVMKQPTGTKG